MVGRSCGSANRVYMCGGYNSCGPDRCNLNPVDSDKFTSALLRLLIKPWQSGVNLEDFRAEAERQEAEERQVDGKETGRLGVG